MSDAMQGVRQGLTQIFREQFDALRGAIEGLDADALNWTPGPEMNSIAVLYTHLLGASDSMTATVAGEPIDRDRDAEFRVQVPDAAALRGRIDEVEGRILPRIERLTADDLTGMRTPPNDRLNRRHLGSWWLFHAIEHNREHLGQALVTRQLYEQRAG